MRYFFLLCFLFFYSHFVFAQEPNCESSGRTAENCAFWVGQNNTSTNPVQMQTFSFCVDHPTVQTLMRLCSVSRCPSPFVNDPAQPTECVCPDGQFEYLIDQVSGQTTCGPVCNFPQIPNIVTAAGVTTVSCIDDPNSETPEEKCPDGKPKVNGQCPVCIFGKNEDGTCVDDSGAASSGANGSTPTSSPDSGSSGSAASNGDDGDPDDPDGSGGGGNNGGNTGGGSASAAASSSANNTSSGTTFSAASASSSGNISSSSGQCDPTAKTYLSCISSQKITPSDGDIPWVPNSGYGNWIPVGEDSPCPNKYRDASGNWWCAGGGSGGNGGASGSAASGGASGSARSAGKCDPTSEDYLRCISGQLSSSGSQASVSSAASSAGSSRSGAFSSLGEKGEFDEELSEKRLEDLKQELEDQIADIKADVAAQVGGTISGNGTLQDFCKNIRSTDVCFGMKKFEAYLGPISSAIFLLACVLSFYIVLRN